MGRHPFAAEAEVGIAPNELILGSNYPNPFNPTTNIEFTLPEPGRAVLQVFNMIGQHVATLFDGPADGGRIYQVTFSASSPPTGLYFYRLKYGNQSVVKRMMLVK
ncbi:MAG: T9SS type A sorting domain-containing protein [Bacteroidota bacterium]